MPGPNSPYTQLSSHQVLQQVFDETTDKLRVDASLTLGENEVVISHVDDSIKIGDGTDTVTTTTVGSDIALNVHVLDGNIISTDNSDGGGLNDALTVGLTAVEAKVGATPLLNRKELVIFHNGLGNLWWGMNSGVTSLNGIPLYNNTLIAMTVGPNTHIWLISDTAGQNVRIAEMAL